jgi:glycosyltransferase involved in cell wall biosynthesis
MRVLYSFPHRIGMSRICGIAWEQVRGVDATGVDVIALVGSSAKPLPATVEVVETLARGSVKLPYRLIGSQRMLSLHDRLVARWLRRNYRKVDAVHLWPSGALETLRTARRLGVPTLLERPNAHTRYAFEVVRAECDRIGVPLPPNHEHAYKPDVLAREEAEFELADALACPSEFVAQTFRERGFADDRLRRHFYGVDINRFRPATHPAVEPFTAVFVGVAAVRKGLHFALEAWHRSTASDRGRFVIAGDILPAYRNMLAPLLDHPSVVTLGHVQNVPELMHSAHALLLPTIEEGFGLVCTEAMASGVVPLVSNACTELCRHGENALVHRIGDVDALAAQLSLVSEDEALWRRLRDGALAGRQALSWDAAGERLGAIYADLVA